MMPFMALAAGMVLAALAIVIVPLVRRRTRRTTRLGEDLTVLADGMHELDAELAAGDVSQAEYDRARTELERQALRSEQAAQAQAQSSQRANWAVALATAIALPLLVATLYLTVGQPAALSGGGAALAQAGGDAPQAPDEATIAALKARVAKDAKDAEGWVLLARASFQLGHMDDAIAAYAKVTGLVTDNPNLWVEYANTLAIAHNRDLAGEPTAMVERALKLDPNNFNALAFAGLAAFQRGDHATALRHWQHLKTLLPAGGDDAKAIDDLIARAGGNAQGLAESAPTAAPEGKTAIDGTVTLATALAGKVTAADTLFVFARAPNGPPMPLAAVRMSASAWPASFTLDDSSSMVQSMRLSKFPKVNLVARVSKSGSATPQPGDIEGHIDDVATGSQGVHIVLDRIVER